MVFNFHVAIDDTLPLTFLERFGGMPMPPLGDLIPEVNCRGIRCGYDFRMWPCLAHGISG